MTRTKKIICFSLLAVFFPLLFSVCENVFIDNILKPRTITFDSNGGSYVESQKVLKGDRIIRPADPVKAGNEFEGWYQDIHFIYEWDFNTAPDDDITLYAKWDDSGITLSPSELNILKIAGYAPLEPYIITITNMSGSPTGELTISIDGENADCFVLSDTVMQVYTGFGTETFTIVPKHGLELGYYTAAVHVKGNEEGINDNISKSINVSFRVVKDVTGMVIVSQPALEYTYSDPLDLSKLTVNVSYSDGSTDTNLPYSDFESSDRFFTTIPAHGDMLSVLENDGSPVRIFWVDREIMSTDNLIVRPMPIYSAAVTVTSPIAGNAPDIAASVEPGSNFTVGSVTWTPNDTVFIFENLYKAEVTLTIINGNYTFTGGLTDARINGQIAAVSDNTGTTVTLSHELEATRAFVSGITIKTEPATLVYTHGSALSLAGLEIRINYSDGTWDDVAYNDFSDYGDTSIESIITSLDNGEKLSRAIHNHKAIIVTYSNLQTGNDRSASTNYLIVNPKTLTITGVTAADRIYNSYITVELSGGILQGVESGDSVDFSLGSGSMETAYAGNNKPVTPYISLTGDDADNYTLTQPAGITVNISRAPLFIAGVDHTKPYDGETSAEGLVVTFNGIAGYDDVYAGTVTAAYTNANAGTREIRITAITLSGESADSYTMSTPLPANFLTETGSGITKAPGLDVEPPTWNSNLISGSSIAVNALAPTASGQTFQYAISNQPSGDVIQESAWGNGTTFTLFNNRPFTNETYYVFARSSSTNPNYDVGYPSFASEPITLLRVRFNSNRGTLADMLVLQGNSLTGLVIPIITGYYLEGLYKQNTPLSNKWDFAGDEKVQTDMTLFANWKINPVIKIIFNGTTISISADSDDAIIYLSGGLDRPTEMTFTLENSAQYSLILWNYDDYSLASNKVPFAIYSSNALFNQAMEKKLELTVTRNSVQHKLEIPFSIKP